MLVGGFVSSAGPIWPQSGPWRHLCETAAGHFAGCAGRGWVVGRLGCTFGGGLVRSACGGDRVERAGGRRARRTPRQLGSPSGRRGRPPGEVDACRPGLQAEERHGLERVPRRQRVDDLRALARPVLQGAGAGPLQWSQRPVEPVGHRHRGRSNDIHQGDRPEVDGSVRPARREQRTGLRGRGVRGVVGDADGGGRRLAAARVGLFEMGAAGRPVGTGAHAGRHLDAGDVDRSVRGRPVPGHGPRHRHGLHAHPGRRRVRRGREPGPRHRRVGPLLVGDRRRPLDRRRGGGTPASPPARERWASGRPHRRSRTSARCPAYTTAPDRSR